MSMKFIRRKFINEYLASLPKDEVINHKSFIPVIIEDA